MNLDHLPQNPSETTNPNPSPTPLNLATTAPHTIQWLWPNRIPLGKLTLLNGSPGSGTSLFALHLAACLSTGSPWPDGTPSQQGNVLLIAPHDNLNDTIMPRLQAAGADPTHIFSLSHIIDTTPSAAHCTRPFALPHDLALLENTIIHMHIRLIILDPFTAIPGLRRSLLDLVQLAECTNCAILLTNSLRQSPHDPLHVQSPTSPVSSAARSHLLLAPDPTDQRKHLLLTTKHSLCSSTDILSYEIIITQDGTPTLHWLGKQDATRLARLSTAPLRSPHRQAILHFLHTNPTARSIKDILEATSYDQEAGRKMILRMRAAGELVSPARGLYTTADHPCLVTPPTPQPEPDSDTVPNVPQHFGISLDLAPLEPSPPSLSAQLLYDLCVGPHPNRNGSPLASISPYPPDIALSPDSPDHSCTLLITFANNAPNM